MEVKEKWTNVDFDEMGWHDSRLYQFKFPDESFSFTLYLDYIFKWVEEKDSYKFWVSPCELTFKDVYNLKLNLSFENHLGLYISDIKRKKLKSINNNITEWEFEIETDRGSIEFTSTDFEMNLISEPILSESQDLNS